MYVNGELHCIYGEDVFLPLSDYLRTKLYLTGTKEVCIEGDCGACTVLCGKFEKGKTNYQTIDACICYVYQLDKSHIVTVEGVKNSKLNPVQEAMVNNHGAQCGYCTPGFVVSLYSLFNFSPTLTSSKPLNKTDIKNALVGNLCRCTGYETIIEAGLSVDPNLVEKLYEIYPDESLSKINNVQPEENKENIEINTGDRYFAQGATLKEALRLKNENLDAKLLAGGTDLHVLCNKKDLNPKKIIYLSNLTELKGIEVKDNCLVIGGGVTLSEFESLVSEYYPGLKEFLELFGSPQIRNIATLVGNIANASPIGDTLPFLLIMNAELILENIHRERKININDFYKGYKSLAMEVDEIITHVKVPLLAKDEILRLYKVSKRKHLDISSFSAAIKMKENNGSVQSIRIAFGGVGPTVQRIPEVEGFLCGKRITERIFKEASELIDSAVKPISDVRGSKEYRLQLAKNSLMKFYFELAKEEKVLV